MSVSVILVMLMAVTLVWIVPQASMTTVACAGSPLNRMSSREVDSHSGAGDSLRRLRFDNDGDGDGDGDGNGSR